MLRLFARQLREPATLRTAGLVGTLINAYGQLLVPWLRGSDDVLATFGTELSRAPGQVLFSIGLGFVFPWLVSAYAGARARLEFGEAASLARFPNLKPDPVFRAAADGSLVALGAATRAMFEQYRVRRAQDILGADVWSRLVSAVDEGGHRKAPEEVYFAPAAVWYLVTAAKAPDGFNVYLTLLSRDGRGEPAGSDRVSA